MYVISVDPGLDGIGVAVWDAAKYEQLRREIRPEMAAALRALVGVFTVTTDPADPIDVRLAEVVAEMRRAAEELQPVVAYVETPAYTGDYGDDPSRRPSTNKLYMGLGAVLAGLGSVRPELHVVTVRAGQTRKSERRIILEQNARVAGVRLPEGLRGGARPDEIDAIWIGAYGLTERLNRDLAALCDQSETRTGALTMPYDIRRKGSKFQVVKETDGEVMGTHRTREKAERQRRAIYASESKKAKPKRKK